MNQAPKRDHLRRLPEAAYCGHAVVHWTLTIRDRGTGWLDAAFYYHFRELLTHSQSRFAIACPIFCLMPDHMHLMWMGILECSNQKLAMRHLRTRCNETLKQIGFEWQDQPYDHVLREDERQQLAFAEACEYIARNPERAGLVGIDEYAKYPFTGCLVPGYPELKPFAPDYWTRFNRTFAWLCTHGLINDKS
ncbi:MAG: hypothetical protein MUF23_11775 [Pirellula sp.]|nr:hypothetical protein [Pirellula sp.]